MIKDTLSTLKINKLTQAQYDAALAAGTIQDNELYMTPATSKLDTNTVLTGTLSVGQTEITFTNSAITEDSIIDVYTNVYGVNPIDITSTAGNITLQFYQQEYDVQVRVEVKG